VAFHFRVERIAAAGQAQSFGVWPAPIDPNAEGIRGEPGGALVVTEVMTGRVVARYEWSKIPINPGDPDSFTDWGWRQVVNEDVSPEVARAMAQEIAEFGQFMLPQMTSGVAICDIVEEINAQNEKQIADFAPPKTTRMHSQYGVWTC
jgi:hypothetical protein